VWLSKCSTPGQGARRTAVSRVLKLLGRCLERRRERLEAGVAEDALERISGPCGLDVGADTQEETALSILAEILAVRAHRGGGPLKQAKQRIHAEV
jgi:xanthine dehydrogenase accessory factor